MKGEEQTDAPYWLEVNLSPDQLDPILLESWKTAASYESSRIKRSPYHKFHRQIVYNAAVDLGYREGFLEQVFADSSESSEELLIVAAGKNAYREYQVFNVYICQPNRPFRSTSHIGFYADGQIQKTFPFIEEVVECIRLSEDAINDAPGLGEELRGKLLHLVEQLQQADSHRVREDRPPDKMQKVMFLTAPDDLRTVHIPNEIKNDLENEDTGRTVGFTQGQRYVKLEAIKQSPTTTSELLRLSDDSSE
jgi:hypothetical protein